MTALGRPRDRRTRVSASYAEALRRKSEAGCRLALSDSTRVARVAKGCKSRLAVAYPGLAYGPARLRADFVGPDPETREQARSERGAYRDIGGIAPSRDEDAPDARRVVASIECVPCAAQVRLDHPEKSMGASDAGTPMSPRYPVQ